jgi:hypothetical protein
MKKRNIIIASVSGALALVAVGIAVKKAKDKKALEEGGGDGGGSGGNGGGGSGGGTGGGSAAWGNGCYNARDTSAYGLKVMQLQKNVGLTNCDVDGLVGNQTNGAVKTAYPTTYAKYGAVTPSNIDTYLNAKSLENQAIIANDLDKAVALLKAGKKAKCIKETSVFIVTWDDRTGKWVKIGGVNVLMTNTTMTYAQNDGAYSTSLGGLIFTLPKEYFKGATGGSRDVVVPLSSLVFQ